MVNEATAKARRSEALFRSSNAGISRRWLTDKVADLEWECARLRVQLEDAAASNGRLEERCSKLRELCKAWREFAGECLTYATCVEDHEVTDAIERFAAKLRMAGDAE